MTSTSSRTRHLWRSLMTISLLTLCSSGMESAIAYAQGAALELNAGAVIEFPHNAVMHTTERVTVEGLVRGSSSTTGVLTLFERYLSSAEHKNLVIEEDGGINFLYAGSPWQSGGVVLPSGTFPMDGAWHHVAFVRHQDGTYSFYLDGQSVIDAGPGPCWLTCNIINATTSSKVVSSGMGWQVDELRVSSTDRYSGPFAPPARHVSDLDTVLLLHLDEAAGHLVGDSGAASQYGTITGSFSWVLDCNMNGIDDASDLVDGVSMDCNANGIPDECEIADDSSLDCNTDGLLDNCQVLADPSLDCDGDGTFDACQILTIPGLDQNSNGVLDSCECLVSNYCTSTPNTTNQPALMGVQSIPSLTLNNFVLRAGHLPPGEPGIFYFGPLALDPPLTFGDGYRCVGGSTVRLYPPLVVNGNGSVSRQIDFTQFPTNGFAPGQTAYFQFWYRDHPAVGAGWNLSDALEVTFCP